MEFLKVIIKRETDGSQLLLKTGLAIPGLVVSRWAARARLARTIAGASRIEELIPEYQDVP
jgi:hypothetical protein